MPIIDLFVFIWIIEKSNSFAVSLEYKKPGLITCIWYQGEELQGQNCKIPYRFTKLPQFF